MFTKLQPVHSHLEAPDLWIPSLFTHLQPVHSPPSCSFTSQGIRSEDSNLFTHLQPVHLHLNLRIPTCSLQSVHSPTTCLLTSQGVRSVDSSPFKGVLYRGHQERDVASDVGDDEEVDGDGRSLELRPHQLHQDCQRHPHPHLTCTQQGTCKSVMVKWI